MKNSIMATENEEYSLQTLVKVCYTILDSLREPLIVLDSELKVIKANRPFYTTFEVKPAETEGRLIYEIGNRQWDIPELRKLLEDILPKKSEFNDLEVEQFFEGIGHRIMLLNARRLYRRSEQTQLILLAIEDVTQKAEDQRKIEELVGKRTVELIAAKEEAERKKDAIEAAYDEIKKLKDQLEAERTFLQEEIKIKYNHEKIVGESNAIKYVLHKIEQIASSDTTVLILGETGTGKELVAHAVHRLSLRKNKTLIKVNCATLPANLIESELFGHEKGAFTGSHTRQLGRFEIADGATIFLDEIGELPIDLQAKLLKVIQDGEFERLGSARTIKVNTRILAATNRNLEDEVRTGGFREDLWYRLNVFPITVPPLRDRLDDIPMLAGFFIKKICKRMGRGVPQASKAVVDVLQGYSWPGNIRELENVLERAVINSPGSQLRLADELRKKTPAASSAQETLKAVERRHILHTLEQTGWKVSGKNSASEILGLNRSTLRARMAKLNIVKPHP
ncbi:sigma 54-interacting transcriptional regulator [Desulfogranum japonicum]|uniref:sigma 54-interacting transcriptional regulator n=1 Tax=Desulfogranum japonicum TaxID=231447 RepID=UPI0009FC2677|nr:sigma 54-interacting transcriptional regulator [Desulfogranum japonicum]